MATLDQARNYGTSLTGLALQLVLTVAVTGVCLGAFAALRTSRRFRHLYEARSRFLRETAPRRDRDHDPPPPGLWRLLRSVLALPEQDLIAKVGLDAAVFMRFNRVCVLICLVFCCSVTLVLVPIHVSFTRPPPAPEAAPMALSGAHVLDHTLIFARQAAPPNDTAPADPGKPKLALIGKLDTYSMLNLPPGTKLLYFHSIMTYLVSAVVLLALYSTYTWYEATLHRVLKQQVEQDKIHLRSVLIRGIPPELRSEEKLRAYFQQLKMGHVESIVLYRRISKLDHRLAKREYSLRKLEQGHLKLARKYWRSQNPSWLGFKERILSMWQTFQRATGRYLRYARPGRKNTGSARWWPFAKSARPSDSSNKSSSNRRTRPTSLRARIFNSTSRHSDDDDDGVSESDSDLDIHLDAVSPKSEDAGDLEMALVPGSVSHFLSTLPPTEAANQDTIQSTAIQSVGPSLFEFPTMTERPGHLPSTGNEGRINSLSWDFITHPLNRDLFHRFQPTHRTPLGTKVYTIDANLRKFLRQDEKIRRYREYGRVKELCKPTPTAFITFRSPVSAAICAQTFVMQAPGSRIKMAPEPRDIVWSSFALSDSSQRWFVRAALNLLITFLIFIWIIPISLAVALVNLEQIVALFTFLQPILEDQNDYVRSFLTSVLPTFTATLFNIAFPYLLMILLKLQGFYTKSDFYDTLTSGYYSFLFFNVLLTFTIGQTLLRTALSVFFFFPIDIPGADHSTNVTNILMMAAKSIPKGANFYLNYIIFQANLHACELIQVNWGLFIAWWKTSRFSAKTPRDLKAAKAPWSFAYFYYWSSNVLVLVITIVYSIIHPLISLCGLFYFAFGYIVYRHQLMYAYVPSYETNGRMFPRVVNWVIIGLLLFQITMMGLIATNGIYVGAALLLPLPGITFWFRMYCRDVLKSRCHHLPIEILMQSKKSRFNANQDRFSGGELKRLKTLDRMHESPVASALPSRAHSFPSTPSSSHLNVATSVVPPEPWLSGSVFNSPGHQTPSDNTCECISTSSTFNEIQDPDPQTYYSPALWAPLPSSMWLPTDPLHKGSFDLDSCIHVDSYCPSRKMAAAGTLPGVDPDATPIYADPSCPAPGWPEVPETPNEEDGDQQSPPPPDSPEHNRSLTSPDLPSPKTSPPRRLPPLTKAANHLPLPAPQASAAPFNKSAAIESPSDINTGSPASRRGSVSSSRSAARLLPTMFKSSSKKKEP